MVMRIDWSRTWWKHQNRSNWKVLFFFGLQSQQHCKSAPLRRCCASLNRPKSSEVQSALFVPAAFSGSAGFSWGSTLNFAIAVLPVLLQNKISSINTHTHFSLPVCTTPFKTVEYIHLLNAQYAFPMAFLQARQHLLRVGFKQNTWNNLNHLPSGNLLHSYWKLNIWPSRNSGFTMIYP